MKFEDFWPIFFHRRVSSYTARTSMAPVAVSEICSKPSTTSLKSTNVSTNIKFTTIHNLFGVNELKESLEQCICSRWKKRAVDKTFHGRVWLSLLLEQQPTHTEQSVRAVPCTCSTLCRLRLF